MRVALDTNVLVYAEGVNDAVRRDQALSLLRRMRRQDVVLPAQVLGELFHVLVRKARRSRQEARDAVASWHDAFGGTGTGVSTVLRASDLAVDHGFGTWDAVVLAAASEAGCRLLLSEDLQEGFTWGGVTVVDPFAATPHRLLAGIVAGD